MTDLIWKRPIASPAELTTQNVNTLVGHLGIEFVQIGDNWIEARMPVDHRTVQPMGIVHGGASVALAETIGSVASNLCLGPEQAAVGLDINANHLRPATSGWVYGRCHPIHLGRSTHVWHIELKNEQGQLTCVSRLTMAIISRPPDQVRKPPAT